MTTTEPTNNFETARAALMETNADRTARAKRWQRDGGTVVAYVGNTIPLESIHAAGAMPFHLNGLPAQATPLADQFMEPAFDPWTRSVFDRLLLGAFDFVDAIVLPRSNDSYQRLYYYCCEIQRKHKQFKLPPVYLVNLLHSPRRSTTQHNTARLGELREFLSDVGTVNNVSSSIALYNRLRRQVAHFNQLRAQPDTMIENILAYSVYAAAQTLPPEEFLQQLTTLCDQMPTQPESKQWLRLVVAGNGVDHPTLHTLANECGVTVVGDYHGLGNHFLPPALVDENNEPIAALAEHYQYHCPCTRSFNTAPDDVVRFAQQQQADAVLFHYLQKEEALSWHYPKQQRAAAAAGLRTALLIDQPYELDRAALKETLKGLTQ